MLIPDNLLVSILINNYNYGRFLAEAIDSALAQNYARCEVIVVDDGSTDNSREIIASYGDRIIPILKENGGQASAFNAGFAASRGSIICFLDSDDIFLPEKATEIVKAFTSHPDCGWFFHSLHFTNTPHQISVENNDSDFLKIYDLRLHFQSGKIKGKLPSFIPATSGLCFTREFLELILPMPEAGRISTNDNYLKYTALALYKGLTIDRKLAILRLHENNAFTGKKKNHLSNAMLIAINAYWIRLNFPFLSKYTNKEFSFALGKFWRNKNNKSEKDNIMDLDYQEAVKKYFSLVTSLEKKQIILKAILHSLKS
jgi:glycosyltransferase involved in cell wall biosynthesis